MNIKEAAKQVKLSPQTLRTWENFFDIKVPRSPNGRIYDESLIALFRQIKELKDSNIEADEIKQQLYSNPTVDLHNLDINPNSNPTSTPDIQAIIKTEIQQFSDIFRDYAKATYQIGKLEAEKQALEEKIKLLPAPGDFYKLQSENEALKRELELCKTPVWKRFLNWSFARA